MSMTSQKYEARDGFLQDHRRYLERLYDQEEKRLQAIETKVLSLIGQSGLIISLLSFTLNLVKEATTRSFTLSLILITCYVAALLSLVVAVIEASKVLDIKKFKYQGGSPRTVLTSHESLEKFQEEEIQDLISSYNVNRNLNDQKGTHLLRARSSFRNALIITAIFGVTMAIALLPLSFDMKVTAPLP